MMATARQSARRQRTRRNELPLLQDWLILNRFFCRLLGFNTFKEMRDYLRLGGHIDEEGWGDDGHHPLFHVLRRKPGCAISPDRLANYDLQIKSYVDRVNQFRRPAIELKYFQYLAVLFAEIYLDRIFNDKKRFLQEINDFVEHQNAQLTAGEQKFPRFSEEDLVKIAFWMATGSGKTLIMHINLLQYLRYSRGRHRNILLITPNEGLSRQHLEEFRKSGIPARLYGESEGIGGLFDVDIPPVTVIEITKLAESKRGGGISVEVDSFGSNNLLFVDEGHRGASGEVWRELRRRLAQNGFTFEYSATFGQIVNGAARERRRGLLEEYGKAIIFDYSYPHFYKDGYGKDYHIINLRDATNAFNEWMLLANLISYYEQILIYEEHTAVLRQYNIEKPLWVFVGHSVTGGTSQEDRNTLTDVQELITFLHKFLIERDTWTTRIDKVIKGETGLKDGGEDLFKNLFPYLRERQLSATQIYDDIVRRVFHAQVGDVLRAAELKAAPGEIGLRAGADRAYFAVINIGDVSGLMKLLMEQGIPCEQDNITGSLFDRINDSQSRVNVLIGSRKFMEGWDSFRVSSIGLLNIGRGEGPQIIQLFGRGVRLWGKDRSLKRSSVLSNHETPPYVRLLETLNVFGVRANYMAKFREYLEQEGIETDFEEISLPVCIQKEFLERGLQVLRLPEGKTFHKEEGVVLQVDPDLSVTLDLRPEFEVARSDMDQERIERTGGEDHAARLKELVPLLDWEHIYFDLLEFKRTKGLDNLSFTPLTLRRILVSGQYRVLCPAGQLVPTAFADLRRAHEVAKAVLRKYAAAFYDRRRRAWEREHLRLQTLSESDPNLSFGGYTLRVQRGFAERVRELVNQADALYRRDVDDFPNIHFDRHLYQPLLLVDGDGRLESSPPGLNGGEAKFVRDLREYLQQSNDELLDGKEVFLLRNLTRGKGIGFFEGSTGDAFYPDFILWVIQDGRQWISFIDPHGLRMARGGFNDPKIRLHMDLESLEPMLNRQCTDWQVYVTSFILATSRYEEIMRAFGTGQHSKEEFEKHNILFLHDPHYIRKLLSTLLGKTSIRR